MASDLHLPHQLAGANKTLTAQCHCKSTQFTITVPTSALPLPVHLCHCTICRYTHGTLVSEHAPLPKGVEPEFVAPSSIESSLTGYIHSPQAASERFFCTTCGCHIGDRDLKPDPDTGKPEWRVATAVFSTHDDDTFQIRSHVFTSPTTAGEPNLATWLPAIGSRTLHIWNPAPDDPTFPLGAAPAPTPAELGFTDRDLLLAQCHCAGVRFTISRPDEAEAAHPFLSRFLRRQAPGAPSVPTSSSASGALKRVACLCLCRDCRLTAGVHAVPWTFVPVSRIRPPPPPNTLRTYRSSDKVTRQFCGVCGAVVFYALEDNERCSEGEKIVDVAVGLLRDWEGTVAAEEWLAWRTGRLAGMKTGLEFDKEFAESLTEGLKNWGLKTHGETTAFHIPQV
ncbi:Mss4-like protein [Corynascus similis CBS 632.67]